MMRKKIPRRYLFSCGNNRGLMTVPCLNALTIRAPAQCNEKHTPMAVVLPLNNYYRRFVIKKQPSTESSNTFCIKQESQNLNQANQNAWLYWTFKKLERVLEATGKREKVQKSIYRAC